MIQCSRLQLKYTIQIHKLLLRQKSMHPKKKKYKQFLEECKGEGPKLPVCFPSSLHTSPDASELAHVGAYL